MNFESSEAEIVLQFSCLLVKKKKNTLVSFE